MESNSHQQPIAEGAVPSRVGAVTQSLYEPTDFSLVQGGPLFQLFLRAGLIQPSMDLNVKRIVLFLLITWLPLLLLSAWSGQAIGGVAVPFLLDLGAHTRLLLCVPIFLAAELIVHRRIKPIVRQFLDRGLVAPEDQPRFEGIIASAMRLRNSVPAEVLLLAFTLTGGYWLGERYMAQPVASWYAIPGDDHTHLTMAGYWYVFVSLTVFRFLWLRWYFRLFVWYRLLWHITRRIPLRLNALHPDRAGGLGFLAGSMYAFLPILLAHSIGLAGIMGGKIWHEGATLPQFKVEIATWLVLLLLLVLVPLFFFVFQLSHAKRTGLREYGLVACRYVDEFRRKWIEGQAGKDETLEGTADIQSLADLSNSFAVVQEMGMVPFGRAALLRLAFLIALPFAPLTLTMIPLEQLIDRALGVLL